MRMNRIAAIIISAGYSSRMKCFKPLLPLGDSSAIERLIQTYQRAGIGDIIVVTGFRGENIIEKLKGLEVQIVLNDDYAKGMFTSIKRGIFALGENIDAFFVQPVDIPLVKETTLKTLIHNYVVNTEGVYYPTFNKIKGHPPLIDCKYNSAILNSYGEGGLKKVLEEFKEDSICVPVYDNAILMDMDKKEDYEKLLQYENLHAPNKAECQAIMELYQVPQHIIKHCEAVESVARVIYNQISLNGIKLDDNALFAAALLHDMARKEKNHPVIGGNMIKEMGYGFVGEIIAYHMDIEVKEEEPISEKEVLYLADKLVKEDVVCNIDERFEQALKDKGENPLDIEKIKKRWISTKIIIKKIERITGEGFCYENKNISHKTWKNCNW
ncbi:MAG: phosphohydrolase [Anaerocolumna sp.]|jgi:CTP:molybdopterin cytidylyltransferase MocA|nr:phosphohydrolase [Anaerocolumna sp.]